MKNCISCLWNDQCGELSACEESGLCNGRPCHHYSPIDDTPGCFTYYESILAENIDEYRLVVAEYADGRLEDEDHD